MGVHCSSTELPQVSSCINERARGCGLEEAFSFEDHRRGQRSSGPSLTQKGLVVCADSVDELVRALPFEMDTDLEHLYELPGGNGAGGFGYAPVEPLCYGRDVGVRCEYGPEAEENQDNYACLQVNDLANPWGLYAVADGSGPAGRLVSALLVHELPGLLVQNPGLHRNSSSALYQTFVSVGEMVATCQYVDASWSGSTLSSVLLREGLLHLAWVGDSKAVLGRLQASSPGAGGPNALQGSGLSAAGSFPASSSSGSGPGPGSKESARAGAGPGPGRKALSRGGPSERRPALAGGPPPPVLAPPLEDHSAFANRQPAPLLRAVELTAAAGSGAARGGAGGGTGEALAFGQEWSGDGSEAGTGTGHGQSHASRSQPAAASRGFGRSAEEGPGPCTPEVRRMRLKPEDVFVVLGTAGLWARLSPTEVVTIVGQHLHRPATAAAEALAAEAQRRAGSGGAPGASREAPGEDLTVLVVYLQGDRYVQAEDTHLLNVMHTAVLREVRDLMPGWGCLPSPPPPDTAAQSGAALALARRLPPRDPRPRAR